MIRFVELECPNCGGDMKKVDDNLAKCPSCGSEYLIDDDKPTPVTQDKPAAKKSIIPIIVGVIICVYVIWFVVTALVANTKKEVATTPTAQQEVHEISDFFAELIRRVYGKTFEDVSGAELAELTYLHIYWQNGCDVVEYARNHGEVEVIELSDDLRADYVDVRIFTGLESLKIPSEKVPSGALTGLNSLIELWARNSPSELVELVPNPKNVKVLGCYDAESLIGIDTFENLEQFYVSDYDLSDIGGLSALKKLKNLEIRNGDAITDFGVLHALPNLEALVLETENLKEISFVEKMNQLKALSLTDTIVLDISVLEGKTSITSLTLEDNYEITDYSVLSTLTGLENLVLELKGGTSMPNASKWTKLKSLTLSGAKDISSLSNLPELKTLHLAGLDCGALSVLASLGKLETLKLGNLYGDLNNLDMLSKLVNLKSLDISKVTVYGNVEAIFSIPNLEYLDISDCEFEVNFDKISQNTNIKYLYMDRVQLLENISVAYDGMITYVDYDKVNVADQIDFLSHFPNIEELYLQGNKLTDVAFTEHLTKLKKLDITDNYVTDLRPLQKLTLLETVWCGENSISQGTELGQDVTVILDSEADDDEWWK